MRQVVAATRKLRGRIEQDGPAERLPTINGLGFECPFSGGYRPVRKSAHHPMKPQKPTATGLAVSSGLSYLHVLMAIRGPNKHTTHRCIEFRRQSVTCPPSEGHAIADYTDRIEKRTGIDARKFCACSS